MNKRRDALSLFEVIARSRDRSSDAPVAVLTPPSARVEKPRVPVPSQAKPLHASPAGQPAPAASHAALSPWRMKLSLGGGGCVAVFFGVLVLMMGAYMLGRVSIAGGVSAQQELPATAQESPAEQPKEEQAAPSAAKDALPAALTAGKYHLVIQTILGGNPAAKAQEIALFCGENDLPAVVRRLDKDNKYVVVSARPFEKIDQSDPAVIQHARQIEEVGKKYNKLHGDYDFRQHNSSGAITPFFVLERAKE